MIIKNLFKEYVSKKGKKCKALNGFNAEFPDKGIVFILGKSGCGKSTLLNLMGCLDNATSGEIIVGNQNITEFTEQEKSIYRANNIGFIFQNFNLFEQLNVYENIVFNIPNITQNTEKKIDELLEILDIVECKYKNINELSGGQQQRVSIVRALMKDCKILLADEPTGNLDELNGKLIFDKLKHFSRDRLVIVVTHDRENAYQYGDIVIEMKDGIVESYNLLSASVCIDKKINLDMKKKKSKKSLKTDFKLSVNFMIKKKFKMILSIIMLAISLGIMGVTSMFYQYNFGAISSGMLVAQSDSYLTVARGFRDPDSDKFNMTDMMRPIEDELISQFQDDYSLKSVDKTYQLYGMIISQQNSGNSYMRNYVGNAVLSNEENLSKYGFSLRYGAYPTNSKDIAVTDFLANSIALQQPLYIMKRLQILSYDDFMHDNELVSKSLYNLGTHTLEMLFGQEWETVIKDKETLDYVRNNMGVLLLNEEIRFGDNQYHIVGIISTNYQAEYGEIISGENHDEIKMQELNIKSMHIFNSFFVSAEWIENPYNGKSITVGNVCTIAQSVCSVDLPKLKENEIYMSRNLFRKYFGEEFNQTQIEKYIYKNRLTLVSSNGNYKYNVFEDNNLQVVGVYDAQSSTYEIICTDNYLDVYRKGIFYCHSFSFDKPKDEKVLTSLINKFDKYDFCYVTANSYFMYNLSDILEIFKLVFLLIGIVLGAFSAIMVCNYFSIIVQNQKKEIGIMRAIGISGRQITSIYLLCSVILMVITILIAWLVLSVLGILSDQILVEKYIWFTDAEILGNWHILTFTILPFAMIGVSGILISMVSTIYPIYKIKKMKPIDAIRND